MSACRRYQTDINNHHPNPKRHEINPLPALSLSNIQYQISSKIRLGLPPLPLPSDCASCHTQDACALDLLHPLVCIGQKGTKITHRHDGQRMPSMCPQSMLEAYLTRSPVT